MLASVLLLPRLFTFAQTALSLLTWPWQFDYTEGINLNDAVQLTQGRNIYRHHGPEGFLSAPYPPVFYLLNVPFAWLAGPQLWPGRLISLLATVAIAVLLAYIVWKIARSWPAGILAGALWLSLAPVMVWAAMYKQDMVAIIFGLAGLAWALTFREDRRVYIAAVFFALAFYTKQTPLTAAAATTLWLLVRDLRLGLRFVGVLTGVIVVPFFAANLLLRGGFWEHLVGSHALPWSDDGLWKSLRRLGDEYWPLLLWGGASLVGAIVGLFVRREGDIRTRLSAPWTLAILYAPIAWAITLVQTGYEGANYNHLLDGLLSLCMLAGLSVGWLVNRFESGRTAHRAVALLGVVAVGLLLAAQIMVFKGPRDWYSGAWPNPERDADMRNLSRLVAMTPGHIFSEDGHLLLANDRPVLYEDGSTFGPLGKLGRWDDSTLVAMFRERHFSLVLMQHGSRRLTPAAWEAFQEGYTLKYRSDIDTFVPLPLAAPRHELSCALSGGGDELTLKGYTLTGGAEETGVRGGQMLDVTLYWQPADSLQHSYASFVHVVNESGEWVAGQDNPQTGAQEPTTAWQPGKIVTDTATIPLPDDLPEGRYRLVTGMYRVEEGTLTALLATCEVGEAYGDAVSLGWITASR